MVLSSEHLATGGFEIVDPAAAPSETEIVEELDERDGQALFGFARRLGLSDEQADDAVQDVLLRLWLELQRGVLVIDPRAWVYRVLYRLAMDQHRVRRRVNRLVERLTIRDGSSSSPSGPVDDRLSVWSEVDRLPERQRHVLYLRYRADLSYEEIARTLGITPSAARSHATQAVARLRARLSPAGDDS